MMLTNNINFNFNQFEKRQRNTLTAVRWEVCGSKLASSQYMDNAWSPQSKQPLIYHVLSCVRSMRKTNQPRGPVNMAR